MKKHFFLFILLAFLLSGCVVDQNADLVVLSDPNANLFIENNVTVNGTVIINDSLACTVNNGLCNQTINGTIVVNSTGIWNKSGSNVYLAEVTDSVGIRTSIPNYELHINDPASTNAFLQFTHTGTGTTSSNGLIIGSGANDAFFIQREAKDMVFRTSDTDRFVIKSDGKVGIGTDTPDVELHILDDRSLSMIIESVKTDGYSQLRFKGTGRTFQTGVGNALETTFGVADKYFIYDQTAATMRMVIDDNGYVGIGTTTPTQALDVNGNLNVSTVYYDTLTAKSPIVQCSDDWCKVDFPRQRKHLYLHKNDLWEVDEIIYDDVSYTKQSFYDLVQGTQYEDLALKLNNKIDKLNEREVCKSNGHQYNGSCYDVEFVTSLVSYEDAVSFVPVYNVTLEECVELDNTLTPVVNDCFVENDQIIGYDYYFNDGCGWDESIGYFCETIEYELI